MDLYLIENSEYPKKGDVIAYPVKKKNRVVFKRYEVADVSRHLIVLNNGLYNTSVTKVDFFFKNPLESDLLLE